MVVIYCILQMLYSIYCMWPKVECSWHVVQQWWQVVSNLLKNKAPLKVQYFQYCFRNSSCIAPYSADISQPRFSQIFNSNIVDNHACPKNMHQRHSSTITTPDTVSSWGSSRIGGIKWQVLLRQQRFQFWHQQQPFPGYASHIHSC